MARAGHKPVVAIAGAGRVGRALARRLHEQKWRIGPVVTRSAAKSRAATRAIGSGRPFRRLTNDLLAADVVIIAVPDRSVSAIAEEMAKLGAWHGKVVLHTCGALGSRALAALRNKGAAVGSLHPLQTFNGQGAPLLAGIACAIEGDPAAVRVARLICRELGCAPAFVPQRARRVYHAAAVLAAGHVLGMVEAATRILLSAGFSRPRAVKALLPLTRQVLANYEQFGGPDSWTGPASRGDLETVQDHLEALRPFPDEYRNAYAALTRLSVSVLGRDRTLRHRLEPLLRDT
jgi:predicted short-subunit dehydrogenase-like oxidoreductase (DUF2520 family)